MKRVSEQKNKAFTLVETLVAISIFTLAILGMMSILASSISNTGYAKQKASAIYLAQEGIEYLRNERDKDVIGALSSRFGWNIFKARLFVANSPLLNHPIDDADFVNFTRTLSATEINNNEVQISSTVNWTQGSGNYEITFSENLFDWVE